MQAVLDRGPDGELVRRSGVMGVVIAAGDVAPGDAIDIELPDTPHQPLEPV
jgi:MOSC domain-containing protein YiiM